MCDHPNATREDYLRHIGRIIVTTGWAVQAVERDRLRPPYAYTIGLTEFGKPELVVTGMQARRSAELLNKVASHVLHGPEPEPGERVPLIDGPLIEFVEVEVPTAHLLLVGEFFEQDYRALQVVHAYDRDHWPWEASYRGLKGGQPLLGVRALAA
jgi:hypothetical protein